MIHRRVKPRVVCGHKRAGGRELWDGPGGSTTGEGAGPGGWGGGDSGGSPWRPTYAQGLDVTQPHVSILFLV